MRTNTVSEEDPVIVVVIIKMDLPSPWKILKSVGLEVGRSIEDEIHMACRDGDTKNGTSNIRELSQSTQRCRVQRIPYSKMVASILGCMPANITHMDRNIFQEPSKFDPMRFENQSSIPPYSFVAFGGGPRICPGYELARIETLVMMHHVVTRFNWKLCCKDDSYRRDPMPSPLGGLPIQLEPKNSVAST